jgi:hypothetical protein
VWLHHKIEGNKNFKKKKNKINPYLAVGDVQIIKNNTTIL